MSSVCSRTDIVNGYVQDFGIIASYALSARRTGSREIVVACFAALPDRWVDARLFVYHGAESLPFRAAYARERQQGGVPGLAYLSRGARRRQRSVVPLRARNLLGYRLVAIRSGARTTMTGMAASCRARHNEAGPGDEQP